MNAKISAVLAANAINVKEIRHDSLTSIITSPHDFANALGYELNRITKSVFLRTKTGNNYAMAVCGAGQKLDFNKIALILGYEKIEVASIDKLAEHVGYPPTGVCAIGLRDGILVVVDEAVMRYSSVLTGSGEVAVEIEIAPADLVRVSNASLGKVTL